MVSVPVTYGTANACCTGVLPVVVLGGGVVLGEVVLPVVCCWPDGIKLATLLSVLLAFVPTVVMAARHTATMSDNKIPYSTAVGPSSDARKRRMRENGGMAFDSRKVRIALRRNHHVSIIGLISDLGSPQVRQTRRQAEKPPQSSYSPRSPNGGGDSRTR